MIRSRHAIPAHIEKARTLVTVAGDPKMCIKCAGQYDCYNFPMEHKNIILVGLMGVGKTTVGKALAKRLGWRFLDTDQEIEAKTGVSIPVIFEIEGEDGFRNREARALGDVIHLENAVIATGGGIVLREDNRAQLLRSGLVVYLNASPERLIERLRHDRSRPLLQVPDPLARLHELQVQRDPYYRHVADLVVDVDRLGVSGILRLIHDELAKRCKN